MPLKKYKYIYKHRAEKGKQTAILNLKSVFTELMSSIAYKTKYLILYMVYNIYKSNACKGYYRTPVYGIRQCE